MDKSLIVIFVIAAVLSFVGAALLMPWAEPTVKGVLVFVGLAISVLVIKAISDGIDVVRETSSFKK